MDAKNRDGVFRTIDDVIRETVARLVEAKMPR